MFKIWCKFEKCTKKFRKNFLFLRQMHLNCLHWIVSTKKRILVSGSESGNEKSRDFAYHYEWLFATQSPWQWSTNIVKEPSLRLIQCFGPFTMLPVHGSSQTGLLDIYLTTFFVSITSEKYKLRRSSIVENVQNLL